MLTWDELEAHVAAKTLVLWDPKKTGVTPDGRALYMLPDVYAAMLVNPWPGIVPGESKQRVRDRRAAMRQVLERFVTGGRLTLNHDIAELGSKIRRQQHQGHWEFRSAGPDIQTRLFGFFARKGAFVATALVARDKVNFQRQYVSCTAKWNVLSGNKPFLAQPYPVDQPSDLAEYLDRDDDA